MTSLDSLAAHLATRQEFKGEQWIEALEARKREELEFHNLDRETEDTAALDAQRELDLHANRKYYSITASSSAYMHRWIEENAAHRVFLDYACGDGAQVLRAASAGARLAIGLDISDVSIKNGRNAAATAGLSGECSFVQGDCEATELPSDSVDTILCSGMLHHLDLGRAYPELHRILKPGGRLLGVEALGHNPIIQLYRDLTPSLRTAWEKEHIMKVGDIRRAASLFHRGETRFWHLAVLGAVPFRRTPLFPFLLAAGNAVDRALLFVPGLRRMAWQVTFELVKPQY
jgi:SAM-dependent methyltransferase